MSKFVRIYNVVYMHQLIGSGCHALLLINRKTGYAVFGTLHRYNNKNIYA
jgi:hypothetical protein